MRKKILLISPPFLHNKGVSNNITSEAFYYFLKSIALSKMPYDHVKFNLNKNNILKLNLQDLKKKINKNTLILIDANFEPGDQYCVYQKEMGVILNNCKNQVISIVTDLNKNTNLKYWVKRSNYIVGFSKTGVDWANNNFSSNKFVYYPSYPIPKHNDANYKEFLQRPYDIGYIGSNKIFRVNFLSSLLRRGGNKISALFISSYRSSQLIKSPAEYLNLLKTCKYFFCTRATFYQKYSRNILNTKIFDGQFAIRVSEAIACGCIPMYWQPKKGNYIYSMLREKIFHSKIFKNFLFDNTSFDKDSFPYDIMSKQHLQAIQIVEDSKHALNILKSKNDKIIKKKLLSGKKLYSRLIEPRNFIKFILNISKKND